MHSGPSIGSMIRFSLGKSREILFPFNFKRWLKILVIVLFAAAGIPGFSVSFNKPNIPMPAISAPWKVKIPKISPVKRPRTKEMFLASSFQKSGVSGVPAAPNGEAMPQLQQKATSPVSVNQKVERMKQLQAKMERPKRKAVNSTILTFLVAGMIALGLGFAALIVFFLWLASRLNFVLLNTLVTQEPLIAEPFKQNKELGNSYFRWSLVFWGVSASIFLFMGTIGMALLVVGKVNASLGMTLGVFVAPLALLITLAIITIGTLMHDFALPIMYREKISAMKAMHKFLNIGKANSGKIFQYLLIIFGFWILATVVQMIVAVFVALGALIAGGILTIPGIILIKTLPFLKIPIIVLAIFAIIMLILAAVTVVGMIMLPVAIFFRVFALAYLTKIHPDCDLLGFSGKVS